MNKIRTFVYSLRSMLISKYITAWSELLIHAQVMYKNVNISLT